MAETLGELAAAFASGGMTSQALVERCLERIQRLDGQLGSFVAPDADGALVAARESDSRLSRGEARSPLEGIPLSIKDSVHVAGLPSTWGSRALADFKPAVD